MFCSVHFIVAHVHESAVHGTRVTSGLSRRVNNSHQTASKLLQDHALCCSFWLACLLCLFCLCKKAFTGCISYLLGYKRKGQPETKERSSRSQQKHTMCLTPGLRNILIQGLMRFHLFHCFQKPLGNEKGVNKPQLQSNGGPLCFGVCLHGCTFWNRNTRDIEFSSFYSQLKDYILSVDGTLVLHAFCEHMGNHEKISLVMCLNTGKLGIL